MRCAFLGLALLTLIGPVLAPAGEPRPLRTSRRWLQLIGEYGQPGEIVYVLERDGKLIARFERTGVEPREQVLIHPGQLDGERGLFSWDASGRATKVELENRSWPRRKIDGDDGSTFRIKPLRPVADLRPEAMAATPPVETGEFRESDLVDLTTLDPEIKLDIRYATHNNFLGTPFYASPRAFMQRPAAEAVAKAHRALKAEGFGLLIHDAYRPWFVTRMFWDATPDSGRGFVADPSKGSKHNRGCAVDLTLYDLKSGRAVEMVGGYDEFSDRSNPNYPGGTSLQRWHRDLLRREMERQGFTVNEVEWWHFDFSDWRKYRIGNVTFEQIDKSAKPR